MEYIGYYVIWLVPAIAFFTLLGLDKRIGGISFLFSLLIYIMVVILLLLRDPHAPFDSYNYEVMYDSLTDINSVFEVYHKNYTFSFLQYLFKSSGCDFELFAILFSILLYTITMIAIYLIFRDEYTLFTLSAALFVLTSTFILLYTNVIRQGLALSLCLMIVGLIIRKRYFFAVIFSVLAAFSHTSAIIVILAIWFCSFYRLNNKQYKYMIFIIPFSPLLTYALLHYGIAWGDAIEKIDDLSGKEYNNNIVYIKSAILYLLLLAVFFIRKKYKLDIKFEYITNVYIFVVSFCIAFLPVLLMASRLIYYASALMPLIISYFYLTLDNNRIEHKVLFVMFLTIFFGLFSFFFKSTATQLGIGIY